MKIIKTLLLIALATSNGWTSGNKDESLLPLAIHDISPTETNLENVISLDEFSLKQSELIRATEANFARSAVQEQINQQNTKIIELEKTIEQQDTKISELEKTIEEQNARISSILDILSEIDLKPFE